MTEKEYAQKVQQLAPKSPIVKDCFHAFWVGGLICTLGQGLTGLYTWLGMEEQTAGTVTSITLIALSALLTGLSLYDDIARFAGAGTLVPITGFANAVASPALEARTEGYVGPGSVASKIFTIAGPVIVYGLAASTLYGVIYWIFLQL